MQDQSPPREGSSSESRLTPSPPIATLLPGAALLFLGLWLVTDGGPLPLGWGLFVTGLTMVLVGTVAQGVAWGLALSDRRGR